ncbi:hypothetical protein BC826DRAFT_972800 [Russula brevipes]|nr:hypothetical protein BC826DRAFT_972800 [Russula brevipes]
MVHRAAHQSEPTEKVENPAGYRDLVKRGGAEYDAFTVNVGAVCWPKILLRAKALAEERNGKVVPVADGGAIELVVGAEDSELEFIQPENILRAATSVDTFFVGSVRTTDSQGQGIVFRWANTANGSRTQDARPAAAADHVEDSNCPTATVNAATVAQKTVPMFGHSMMFGI